jgi:hypothetical protein
MSNYPRFRIMLRCNVFGAGGFLRSGPAQTPRLAGPIRCAASQAVLRCLWWRSLPGSVSLIDRSAKCLRDFNFHK